MEQIRIIKEMREADERNGRSDQFIRPRFMLWENVVGAFSSNKGEDFRSVLEETAKVKDKTATIPRPPKGKWNTEGCIVGDGWSIAWRVLDAQFWGVPQRRRRIALVADFAGQCAGEILFKRKGLSRNFTESRKEWQATSGDTEKSTNASGKHGIVSKHTFRKTAHPRKSEEGQGWEHTDVNDTLNVFDNGEVRTPTLVCEKDTDAKHCIGFEPGAATRTGGHTYDNQTGSLRANMGDNQFCVAKKEQYAVDFGRVADRIQMNATKAVTLQGLGGGSGAKTGLYCLQKDAPPIGINGTVAGTLDSNYYKGLEQRNGVERECVAVPVTMQVRCGNQNGGGKGALLQINKSATLSCGVQQTLVSRGPNAVAQPFEMKAFGKYDKSEKASCLKSRDYKDSTDLIVEPSYIVRRLTPIECSRLQGLPDWWLDGLETPEPTGHDIAFWREVFETHRKVVTGAKKPKTDKQIIKWLQNPYSDGAAYKLWGNGIALPCFLYVMEGIKEVLDRTSNE